MPPFPGKPVSAPPTLPIQAPQVTREQLADPAYMNVLLQQVFTAINQGNGALGRVVLSRGIDVQGATVTGLGAPQSETDAISSGHAAANFGPVAQAQQLDIGKPQALKGLTAAYALAQQASTAVSKLPTYTSGSNSIQLVGGVILKWGHTGVISTTLAVTFPAAFPSACFAVLVCDDLTSGTAETMSVSGTPTATGFTVHSSGAANGAWWYAIGN